MKKLVLFLVFSLPQFFCADKEYEKESRSCWDCLKKIICKPNTVNFKDKNFEIFKAVKREEIENRAITEERMQNIREECKDTFKAIPRTQWKPLDPEKYKLFLKLNEKTLEDNE